MSQVKELSGEKVRCRDCGKLIPAEFAIEFPMQDVELQEYFVYTCDEAKFCLKNLPDDDNNYEGIETVFL